MLLRRNPSSANLTLREISGQIHGQQAGQDSCQNGYRIPLAEVIIGGKDLSRGICVIQGYRERRKTVSAVNVVTSGFSVYSVFIRCPVDVSGITGLILIDIPEKGNPFGVNHMAGADGKFFLPLSADDLSAKGYAPSHSSQKTDGNCQ